MKKKIFIDGSSGTTGLTIEKHLSKIKEITLLTIPANKRKKLSEKIKCYEEADLIVLCLPDNASLEAVSSIQKANSKAKILDCSTAFRTARNWVYGFAQIKNQREKIQKATKVSNPGCYALAFIAIMRPLVEEKLLPSTFSATAWGISGYTGGGKNMIKKYESKKPMLPFLPYGLTLGHKHLPEMKKIAGLKKEVLFLPSVIAIPQGLMVIIPITRENLKKNRLTTNTIYKKLKAYYQKEKEINISWLADEKLIDEHYFDITRINHTNKVDIFISHNSNQDTLLIARIDNLGKGASLNAVENIHLMLGLI